jgi:hypothetical protein
MTLEHDAPRKRIGVVGYLTVEAEGDASEPGDVRCGIPGFDHPGTELHGQALRSTDRPSHIGGITTMRRVILRRR